VVQAAASKVKSSYFSAVFWPGLADVQRQDEFSLLPGVVQEWRRRHVRGRLLRGFGGIGDTDFWLDGRAALPVADPR